MKQKILIIPITVSLSLTAFLAGYLISQKDFHRNPNTDSVNGNILNKFSDDNTNQQTISLETIRPLSSRKVISPTLSKEKDSVIYYEKGTGKVFETTLRDLQEKTISDVSLANIVRTIWSSSKKEVVSFFYYPTGNHYKYFSYKTRASSDLGTDIKSLVFSPDGSQIVYFGSKEGDSGVFISQPNGSSFKKILSSRLENAEVYWPTTDLLSFQTETADGSELYSLSRTGEIKKVLELKEGLSVKWSKNGTRILFSQQTESGVGLFYKDLNSEQETSLGISTPASKCDWSIDEETLVCGVPKSSMSGDELYLIKLNGTKTLISSPTSRINVEEIFLSGLDDYVVILNSLDSKLYVMKK
jgi:hypothetical protein